MPHMDNVARLVLPSSATPKFQCEICGEGFYERPVHVRHVARCVKRNRDVIEQLARQNQQRDPLHGATDWEAVEFQRKRYSDLLR
jgi:hypothetical protein